MFLYNTIVDEVFHVLNRGVDKRSIFIYDTDYIRFIHNLSEFNNKERTNNNFHCFSKHNDIASRYKKRLVDILAFCLMPNHYHLLLRPIEEGGITKFMQKINIGYAKYFNQKYDRKGTLFESRFKAITVEKQPHFNYLPFYIHLNPLDLKYPEWRKRELKNYNEAVSFLNSYKWSSHLDYLGQNNFSVVLQKDLLTDLLGSPEEYNKDIIEWLKEISLSEVENFILE